MRRNSGFTLVELLIVISIIAILAFIGTTIFTNVKNEAENSVRKADIVAIAKAMETKYDPVTGTYQPITDSDFASGKIPAPPEGGNYFGDITSDSKGFKICATLSGGSPFCVDSEQGVYNDVPPAEGDPFLPGSYPGSPTPTPTQSPTPTGSGPTNTPTPTSGAGTPTPTPLVYGTPYLTPVAGSANCTNTSIWLTPLNDLGTGFYSGRQGGLYPGGSNVRPAAHDSAGLSLADQVQPLDSSGNSDPINGKYVLLSIGMSNTSHEFCANNQGSPNPPNLGCTADSFMGKATLDTQVDPKLVIVNGAQSGQLAAVIKDPAASFWDVINNPDPAIGRLAAKGVTPSQVAVAWVKEVNAPSTGIFPTYENQLKNDLAAIARVLKTKYPNIKIAYYSSRIYAGYASIGTNPEPYAYGTGFSVKWLIEDQINGVGNLSYDPLTGVAPWLSWGPYLWADGLGSDGVAGGVPGRSDGLEWQCSDFNSDGIHPATGARQKVSDMLLNFFKNDSTAKKWFVDGL